MARINLCPNPSSKNDTTDYFGGGARVTGVANTVRATGYRNANAGTTLPRGSVVAGHTYRFSAYVKGDGGNSNGTVNINWYGNNNYLSSAPGQSIAVTDGQTTRCDSSAQVAPAGADQALLNITGMDAPHIVLGVLYEETAAVLPYFDGDDTNSAWTGTNGNSTSTTTDGDSGTTPPPTGGSPVDSTSSEAGIKFGWGQPIYESQFTYTGKPTGEWGLYSGPGHVGNGTRDPARINVLDGVLRLDGSSGGATGGMAHNLGQKYGRWEVRMRAYQTGGSGEQYHPVLIVWPDSDRWPQDGEYDFIENDIGDTTAGAFIHYPHPSTPVQQEHATQGGISVADWHNYAIDWQASGITGYIDGVSWFHYANGAGPAGRSNIQAMPSGHLTIQLDNFGGSPHKTANMDVDWVKIYDDQSFSTTTGVSPSGIPSGETFGAQTFGNRFRLYLNNDPAPVTTAYTPGWEQTAGSFLGALGTGRVGTNTAVTIAETSTSNVFDVAMGQWISGAMTSGGQLKGAFSYVVARNESGVAADLISHAVLKVVSNDGTVVRGIAADVINTTEWGTTLQAISVSANIDNPVTCQPNDRLVLEIGYRSTNVVATSNSGTLRYGGTSADIEAGFTGTQATTLSPWINFADKAVQTLFTGQTVLPGGIVTKEAFGTVALVQPPTLAIVASGIASTSVVPSPVVIAQAAIIAPAGIFDETFGVLSVSNSIVCVGIASAEAFGTHRVRRLSDLVVDLGIPSAETFGAATLVHFQTIAPLGIDSSESFGLTQVEDPARRIFPFGITTAEQFGIATFAQRLRSVSIDSAEAFGLPVFKVASWGLVQPVRVERWRLGDPGNVIYVTNVVGLTVLDINGTLKTVEDPRTEDIQSATHVWQGGHDNITTDKAIRDLWVANGYDVEMRY